MEEEEAKIAEAEREVRRDRVGTWEEEAKIPEKKVG